jgi:hypothetical protein
VPSPRQSDFEGIEIEKAGYRHCGKDAHYHYDGDEFYERVAMVCAGPQDSIPVAPRIAVNLHCSRPCRMEKKGTREGCLYQH